MRAGRIETGLHVFLLLLKYLEDKNMESQYYEHLVACKTPVLMKAARIFSIVAFVASLLFLMPNSLIIGIVGCVLMGVVFWLSNQETSKEYEYVYIDGDISFDAVYNKSKRKNKGKTSWEETKLICRSDAPELEGYRQRGAKEVDFTSGDAQNEKAVYVMVVEKQGEFKIVYFEPAPEMLEMMWRKAPSKVKRQ